MTLSKDVSKAKVEMEVIVSNELKEKVYNTVKQFPRGTYIGEIARLLNINRHTVKKALLILEKEGKIIIERRGNLFYAFIKGGDDVGGEKA